GQATLPRIRGPPQAESPGSKWPCGTSIRRYPTPSSAARVPATPRVHLPARESSPRPPFPAAVAAPASPLPVLWNQAASSSFLNTRLHLLRLLQHFFDGTNHVERLLRNIIVLAFHDLLEAAHGVFNLHVLPFEARELRGHIHRLREEFFDSPGSRYGPLILIGKLFDSQDRDDVLQILIALQDRLHCA